MARGNATSLKNLPKQLRAPFRRALQLAGYSQSKWLRDSVRQFIKAQKQKHGDLFSALTIEEEDILATIESGANDPEHLSAETLIPLSKLKQVLEDLVDRDILEVRRQGGKTDQARGARRPLYFVSEKYQSRPE